MTTENEAVPTEEEIRAELRRVLASKRFLANENSARFLELVVEKALKGEPIKQAIIGVALFPKKYLAQQVSDVRVTANKLRTTLAEYYEYDGCDDRIIIAFPSPPGPKEPKLPAGTPYRPVFSYTPRSPAARHCQAALTQYANMLHVECDFQIIEHFDKAIALDPAYAPAHAGKAEALLREAMYRRPVHPHNPLKAAEASALEALRLQPKFWRAHVALAAVHCCRQQWDEAQKWFDEALTLAPTMTREHPWYAGFLLAMGKEREALHIARARADENPDNLGAQITLSLILYLARHNEEAEDLIGRVVEYFPKSWLARMVQACVYLAKGDPWSVMDASVSAQEAHDILYELSECSEPFDNVFTGLVNLCHFRGGSEGKKHVARESMKGARLTDSFAMKHAGHAAGEATDDDDDWEPGHFDKNIPFWTPLQLALGFIGLEETEPAIDALARAVDQGDPLSVLLPRLPLLDPLREAPEFQALIERMNLPSPS